MTDIEKVSLNNAGIDKKVYFFEERKAMLRVRIHVEYSWRAHCLSVLRKFIDKNRELLTGFS